ncbi:hypothetical protein ACPOL_5195 [Acidisarcina polymorpha]|uniref:Uncharacterized protein n=1 Tax=Acidisarcina polymorpha TaxID=2211140 RepID=A0A2Z5G654_9BACT|nr:hypothetical protein [Acidisarcina polymorpha]AXC14449.1 hypothetical protein ACPOL_5195 [Acidisarcina polymorpha]
MRVLREHSRAAFCSDNISLRWMPIDALRLYLANAKHYSTRWRMLRTADRLVNSLDSVSAIAPSCAMTRRALWD